MLFVIISAPLSSWSQIKSVAVLGLLQKKKGQDKAEMKWSMQLSTQGAWNETFMKHYLKHAIEHAESMKWSIIITLHIT